MHIKSVYGGMIAQRKAGMGHSKAASKTWGQTGAGKGAETKTGGEAHGKNVLLESGQKRSQRSREAAGGQKL